MAGRKKQGESLVKVNTTSVVQQTIDYLTGAIMRREYTPGSRIPTEMELSDLLGVSRNTYTYRRDKLLRILREQLGMYI